MTLEKLKGPGIQELLAQTVLARLASANPNTLQPHVVPVWFFWDGEFLWISSYSNTRKVGELKENPLCSVLIEPEREAKLQAVIIEGPVELISSPREFLVKMAITIYTRYLGEDGVLESAPQSWAYDPHQTILKIIPKAVYAW